MRPKLEMARGEMSTLAARYCALRANVGIKTGGARPKVAFELQNIAAFALRQRSIKGRRLSSEEAALT